MTKKPAKPVKSAPIAQKTGKTGAPKSLDGKPGAEVVKVNAVAQPKSKRADWEAVERDYRTGKFTLRELEKKHGPSYAEISRRSKKEGWTKDLRDIIKQATNAAVLRETVTNAQHDVTNTVIAAAEVNVRVILGHRSQAVEVRNAAESAKAKLLTLSDSIADIKEASTFVGAVESLSRTYKNLHDMERKAFRLDDDQAAPSESTYERNLDLA